MNEYFPLSIVYRGQKLYAIWFTGAAEGLICLSGRLVTFGEIEALFRYAQEQNLNIAPVVSRTVDLDALAEFIADDCRYADRSTLDYWSFFSDLSAGIGRNFAGDGSSFLLNDIYDKLCYGSLGEVGPLDGFDFSALSDDGDAEDLDDRFLLTDEEESLTKAVLKTGLELFDRYCLRMDNSPADADGSAGTAS